MQTRTSTPSKNVDKRALYMLQEHEGVQGMGSIGTALHGYYEFNRNDLKRDAALADSSTRIVRGAAIEVPWRRVLVACTCMSTD